MSVHRRDWCTRTLSPHYIGPALLFRGRVLVQCFRIAVHLLLRSSALPYPKLCFCRPLSLWWLCGPLDVLPCWCGKFKPKLVQKSFLRKSQDLHLDAVPTTYAQRSLRKRGSHTQALRFGAAQPFWTLSQRCCSNKKKHTNQSNKQDGPNHVAVLDYFFAVSLALSQKQPYSLTATLV